MSIRSRIGSLASGFSTLLRNEKYTPSYDQDRFVRALLRRERSGVRSLPPHIDRYWRDGHGPSALAELVDHIVALQSRRSFLDPSSLTVGGNEPCPEASRWIALACDQARAWTREGWAVYEVAAPALRPGFPWGGEGFADRDDVLYSARPHRFAFLPRLAVAVLGGAYSRGEFTLLLRSWMSFASRRPELPFISTFVVTQRLIATTCALSLLARAGDGSDAVHHDLCLALMLIARQDVAYLLPRIGSSYPNGHLLADRFVGWFVLAVHPEFCERIGGLEDAEKLWLAELQRQTYDDGGSFEHAVPYHGLATELALTYFLYKRRAGETVPPAHAHRIRNMLRFQADLAGPDGVAPSIGDGTDDPMLPLDGGIGTTSAAMREVYRRLFAPSIPALPEEHPANERAFWLIGRVGAAGGVGEGRRFSSNPDSGMFVFHDHRETTRCVFRTGPAPDMSTIAGHMHADLLSLCWTFRNVSILVDPGTYSYRSRTEDANGASWRKYFAGPLAHNGVVVRGEDPLGSVVGDFRPGSAAPHVEAPVVVDGATLALVEGRMVSPPSYADTVRGVLHVRGEYFLAYSSVAGTNRAGDVVFPMQLDHCQLVAGESGHVVSIACGVDSGVSIVYSDELVLARRFVGQSNPIRGWVSPRYGELRPATQLEFHVAADVGVTSFALCLNPQLQIMRIASLSVGRSMRAFKLSGAGFTDYVVINADSDDVVASAFGIAFEGRLLWLRIGHSKTFELRALDIVRCRSDAFGIDLDFQARRQEMNESGNLPVSEGA